MHYALHVLDAPVVGHRRFKLKYVLYINETFSKNDEILMAVSRTDDQSSAIRRADHHDRTTELS